MKRFFTFLKILIIAVIIIGSAVKVNAQINWGQIGADIDGLAAGDNFGNTVSLSSDGSVVAVGAYLSTNGSVSVYENVAGAWLQKGTTINGTGSRFGKSVAINGNGTILVAGAGSSAGYVRVYQFIGGNWLQVGSDIAGTGNAQSGWSVSINDAGTRIAFGENMFDDANSDIGRVRIYDVNTGSNSLTLIGTIVGEVAGDQFGQSVSLNSAGNILAAGAIKNGGKGNARIFQYDGTTWNTIGNIPGDAAGDQFGWDLSLNNAGDRLAVSAPYNVPAPYVKIYKMITTNNWSEIGNILGDNAEYVGRYGVDMNAAGNVVSVGGEYYNSTAGRVRIFGYDGTAWSIIATEVLSEADNDRFGYSVSLSDDGTIFASGAPTNDVGGSATDNKGHVRVHKQTDTWTWTGTTNSTWTTLRNWDGSQVPVPGSKVIIPVGKTTYPTLASTATITNLTINSGAASSGSILGQVNLSVSGVTTVNRNMSGNAWHLVAATASGQTISSFLAENTNIAASGATRGMMDYNEGINKWNTFFTNAQGGNLEAGKGYSVRTSADGEVVFTGTLQGGNVTPAVTTTGQGWNNLGNPYPSAIFMNSAAAATNNFITINDASFDPSFKAVYVWEQGNSAYTIVNNTSGAYIAALGQAFMAKAKTGATQMSFTTAMQTHAPAAVLKSGMESSPSVKLVATLADSKTSTIIKFDDNMSEGLDAGYDAGMFKTGFDLYTRLVKDNGVDFGIQCLPTSVFNNGEIVLGLQSTKSGAVIFSAETENLPFGTRIVLEDRLTQTLTELTAGEVYTTQIDKGEAKGRFYLRTLSSVTGLDETGAGNAFRIYQADSRIYISGMVEGKADATLYDLMGRTVRNVKLENSLLNSIVSSGLTNGVYMVKIKHERGIFSQKVLVKNQ